ncbi:hypothetical protein K3495_g8381 [Podosphaera aphanis]|nr:hypothetical protein K3495_g8381 [Podosphaera aphanis]
MEVEMTSKKSPRRARLTRYLTQINTEPKLKNLHLNASVSQNHLPNLPNKELSLLHKTNSLSYPHVPPEIFHEQPCVQARSKGNKLRKRAILSPTSAHDFSDDRGPTLHSPSPSGGRSEKRPGSGSLVVPTTQVDGDTQTKVRKSWLAGSIARLGRNKTSDLTEEPQAWINAGTAKIEYNLIPLWQGEKISELWNDTAEVLVHLSRPESGCGAQFRVSYAVIESSSKLRNLILKSRPLRHAKNGERSSLVTEEIVETMISSDAETPPLSPSHRSDEDNTSTRESNEAIDRPSVHHLFLPIGSSSSAPYSAKDMQRLVDVRNLFALLTSQPLIATRNCPTYFKIFLSIAALLKEFEFSSEDGSSFGTAVDQAFSFCLKEIPQLADCRESKQVTVEALVLAEAMKSTELYNEAFAHAVGKYDSLASLKPGDFFDLISSSTRNRLQKSDRELRQRIRSVNDRLLDFEFPSLFAGIGASTSTAEAKSVRFKQWKLNFASFRRQVIAYYKCLHGQWPPKANSKKNNFVESGLNRLVLRGLYSDLCDLYDFLADRDSLTTRVYDGDGEEEPANLAPAQVALRKLLDEYDRSSPPVQPPVPFDVPLDPSLRLIDPTIHSLGPKEQHQKMHKKLAKHELSLILAKSHNLDADYKTPFLEMFKAFELKEAKGKSACELSEQRHGYWIFLYACLQALPLLVTDAPGVQYSEGVEYFLSQVPLGHFPWIEDQSQVKMTWFGVQGGQHIVSLPSDVVNYGVEATYRQSHCWEIAQKWIGSDQNSIIADNLPRDDFSPLSPPPGFDNNGLGYVPRRGRNSDAASLCSSQISGTSTNNPSSQSRQRQRSSIALGLERVRIESNDNSSGNPSRTMSPISPSRPPQSRIGSRTQSNAADEDLPERREIIGSTFDDILGSMDAGKEVKETKRGKRK